MKPFRIPHLRASQQRQGDTSTDFSLALLNVWAYVGDVLTFYQDRIAEEAALGTASERRPRWPSHDDRRMKRPRGRVTTSLSQAFTREFATLRKQLDRVHESAFLNEEDGNDRVAQLLRRVNRRKLVIGVIVTAVIVGSAWAWHRRCHHRNGADQHQEAESEPGGQRNSN